MHATTNMDILPDEVVVLCFSGVPTSCAPSRHIRKILRSARQPNPRLQCVRSFVLPERVNKHVFHFAMPPRPVWRCSCNDKDVTRACGETFASWLPLLDRSVAIHVPPAQFDIVGSSTDGPVHLKPRGKVWLNGCMKIGTGEGITLEIDMTTQRVKRAELYICLQNQITPCKLHVEIHPLQFDTIEQARLWGVLV